MPRVHVLSTEEAESLKRGDLIDCRNHYHIDHDEAVVACNGAEQYAESKKEGTDFGYANDYQALAEWAVLPSGEQSEKHIVQFKARVLQQVRGTFQLVPGAPLLKGCTARGVSLLDNWKKRQWTKQPRGFVRKAVAVAKA